MDIVQIKTAVTQGIEVYVITKENHVIVDNNGNWWIERIATGDKLPLTDQAGFLMCAELDFFVENKDKLI